jgi:hypothetical protein
MPGDFLVKYEKELLKKAKRKEARLKKKRVGPGPTCNGRPILPQHGHIMTECTRLRINGLALEKLALATDYFRQGSELLAKASDLLTELRGSKLLTVFGDLVEREGDVPVAAPVIVDELIRN